MSRSPCAPIMVLSCAIVASNGTALGQASTAACGRRCAQDLRCASAKMSCLSRTGGPDEALAYAKVLHARYPDSRAVARLLALAYAEAGNQPWALGTLAALVRRDERDCQSRAMLAWLYIEQAQLEAAEEILQSDACPARSADRARWDLFAAAIARLRKDDRRLARALRSASRREAIYAEDQALLRELTASSPGPRWTPLQLRTLIGAGYTSDASAGLPLTAPGGDLDDLPSGLLQLDLLPTLDWQLYR